MIIEKNDNQSDKKSKKQFSPRSIKQPHQATPDWQKVSAQKWLQTLVSLNESAIDGSDRLYWMLTCRDWIKVNVDASVTLDELQLNCFVVMNQLAYRLCDWPLMIQIYPYINPIDQRSQPEDYDQQVLIETLHCAVAFWQLGHLDSAVNLLIDFMPHYEQNSPLHQFYQQVKRDIDANHFIVCSDDNPELYICPLEEQHLSSFTWVYQDSQIAKLCNLPEFNSDEQWYQWLDRDQVNPNKHVFAVNHELWGFVGVVAIEVHDGVGFFYYWLGQDFQGGGLGPQAVELMLGIAKEHMGMNCCYAKVFKHNIASQKAMTKMGFEPVPFAIDKPNDDQMYFYLGKSKSKQTWWQELVDLAAITDIDSKFLP